MLRDFEKWKDNIVNEKISKLVPVIIAVIQWSVTTILHNMRISIKYILQLKLVI